MIDQHPLDLHYGNKFLEPNSYTQLNFIHIKKKKKMWPYCNSYLDHHELYILSYLVWYQNGTLDLHLERI